MRRYLLLALMLSLTLTLAVSFGTPTSHTIRLWGVPAED